MARGRHARRHGLLARLLPSDGPPLSWRTVHAISLVRLSDDLAAVQAEVARLTAGASRSTAAEVVAELRAQRLEQELTAARAEIASLRTDLDALREELVWAFAEHRLPAGSPTVHRLGVAGRRA